MNVNTNPFRCGLWLIGVRDVDCSASSFVFSSATLSLVTICSSIWIFNMFPALFFIVAVVLVSSSNFRFYSYQFISKNSHCKPFVFVLLKSFKSVLNFSLFLLLFCTLVDVQLSLFFTHRNENEIENITWIKLNKKKKNVIFYTKKVSLWLD